MKALLYKEFKLAMHPVCYAFILLFPLLILIPSYPIAVGFIYVLTCYPILFLGANKGQQSNDLLYSTLMPVRKKDIVLARIITVITMQFVFIAIMSALLPLAVYLRNSGTTTSGAALFNVGLGLEGYVSVLSISLLGYAVADLIFFPIYYKRGKSIVMSTLFTILGFAAYLMVFTVAIPFIPGGGEWYIKTLCYSGLGIQFAILGVVLALYTLIHYLVYKISYKELEKVDF